MPEIVEVVVPVGCVTGPVGEVVAVGTTPSLVTT
jgi:hypothetical protein